MKQYISPDKSKTFRAKPKAIQQLINHTLHILNSFGVPTNGTQRRLERMAMAFLACGNVKKLTDLKHIKDSNYVSALKTRDIISFINEHFYEQISSGSYDDIRRKDLKLLTIAGIVWQSSPNSATNDSTRGYIINPLYANLLTNYGEKNWYIEVSEALKGTIQLTQKLSRKRKLKKLKVKLPSGKKLQFSTGKHNDLQKSIIEEFLPRYGFEAEVLYIGDTTSKYLHLEKKKLESLNFFEIAHEELPDVIAYSQKKNWIYLIEAVHTSGAISEIRLLQLQKLTNNCNAEIVYVTAFSNRVVFRKFVADIAWETEVWIADNPDHLIHFNGDKFLGPYNKI